MDLSRISRHLGGLAVAVACTAGAIEAPHAGYTGGTGPHDFKAMIPDECRLAATDSALVGGRTPADALQAFTAELGLSGQQQQDLQILTADYGERLRDLAKLMRMSAERLAGTEPGDPDYWPIAQEVSASAAASSAETIILLSEMREKFHAVLTPDQRAELQRRIEERKAQCKPPADTEQATG